MACRLFLSISLAAAGTLAMRKVSGNQMMFAVRVTAGTYRKGQTQTHISGMFPLSWDEVGHQSATKFWFSLTLRMTNFCRPHPYLFVCVHFAQNSLVEEVESQSKAEMGRWIYAATHPWIYTCSLASVSFCNYTTKTLAGGGVSMFHCVDYWWAGLALC